MHPLVLIGYLTMFFNVENNVTIIKNVNSGKE